MKTFLTAIALLIFTSCTTTPTKENNNNKTIQIAFDKLKNDSNSTIHLRISDKNIELYTIPRDEEKDSNSREFIIDDKRQSNDEVKHTIYSIDTTSNDEVKNICIDDKDIIKITLYNFKNEIVPLDNRRCFSKRELKEKEYKKFDIKNRDGESRTIYIHKDEKNTIY